MLFQKQPYSIRRSSLDILKDALVNLGPTYRSDERRMKDVSET